MAKLTVLSPINHDGVDYAVGDELSLTDKAQMAALLECGSAVAIGGRTPAQKAASEAAAAAKAAADADVLAAAEAVAAASSGPAPEPEQNTLV